ncbi:hypothetical protein [Streptomyces sp. NRRL S-237]|uniref:hypothetical protein n=1 Tax=Streptomyces sp. NRRL S-237 TaxID=1463895 RepID=UPI0004C4B7EA|nr:hypothetical protein [Streptomyces sp. NRRL S-237]
MSSRPSAFEERLKAELLAIAADGPSAAAPPVRSRTKRYRIPLVLAGVTAAVAGMVVLPVVGDGGGASPAYAVSRDADGTIRVHIYHADGVDGTVRELRELGVPIAVLPRRPSEQCPATEAYPAGLTPGEGGGQRAGTTDESAQMQITPKTVPPGHTLVLSTPVDASDGHGIGFGAVETAKLPSCIPVYADPATAPVRTRSPEEAAEYEAKQRAGREEEARSGGAATPSPQPSTAARPKP